MQDGQRLDRRHIYRGRIVDLSVDRVTLPNGNTIKLELVRHAGAAAVVPVRDDGTVLLVRQYRYATGGWLLEIPAGILDGGEAPESCAKREVEEETGYHPGRLVPLGSIWTTPGFSDERIWLYLAQGLQPAKQALGPDEVLTVETMEFEQAVRMAETGEIADAKSVCALLRARTRLALG